MQDTPDDDAPLYRRIRDSLAARIADGTYPVGGMMPTEAVIAAEFGVSRFTVREALRSLQQAGWIERRQGVGSRVLSEAPSRRMQLSATSLEDLFRIGSGTCYVLLHDAPATLDPALADLTGGSEGDLWHTTEGMRWTAPGGRPICHVRSYFPARFAPLVPLFEDHAGPLFTLLETHAGAPVEEVVQEIEAALMPDAVAQALGQRPATPALVVTRRYLTATGLLMVSVNRHPADQMTHVMRFRRAPGAVSVDMPR